MGVAISFVHNYTKQSQTDVMLGNSFLPVLKVFLS